MEVLILFGLLIIILIIIGFFKLLIWLINIPERVEKRITQEELAEQLGVDFSTVNRWFNDKTKPNKMQKYNIEKLLKKGYIVWR